MFTSKHYLNKTYGSHMLSRIVTGYNVTTIDCDSTVDSGYKGTEVTLIDQTPAGYGFDHWNITGATLTGNNFILNNDVTAQGIYTANPTAYVGSYYLTSYYDPRPGNPGSTMDENMAQTRQFVIPVGNTSAGSTRKYYITPQAAGIAGYDVKTGNIPKCVVLGSNRRLSGSITADIRYMSNVTNAICLGIDPYYTTYSGGLTKAIPNQWHSATIIDTQHCSTFGQGGYTNQVKVFNVDISNLQGTLFIATSAQRSVYVNSITANLVETVV